MNYFSRQSSYHFQAIKFFYCLLLIIFLWSSSLLAHSPESTLNLTAEEKEYITNNPIITVGNEMDWPPYDFNELGTAKGLCIDFIKLLAEKAGIKINFISGYSWTQLLNKFKNKEIDVLPILYKLPERKKFALFTKPYRKSQLGLFTAGKNKDIASIKDLKGKKVGILTDAGFIPAIKKRYPNIIIQKYSSPYKLCNMLNEGEIAAVIDNRFVFTHLSQHNSDINVKFVEEIKIPPQQDMFFYIGIVKDKPLLKDILNKAIDSLSEEQIYEVNSKWLNQDNAGTFNSPLNLNPKEIEFLRNHPVINAGNEFAYIPYDFNISGVPCGFSIDILNLIASKAGFTVKYQPDNWAGIIKKFQENKLDLIHTISKNPQREKQYIFSMPYCRYQTHFFTRIDQADIFDIRDLYGKIIVSEKGWFLTRYIKENHPQVKLLEVDSIEEKLDALSRGKADAAVGGSMAISYMLDRLGINNIKAAGQFIEFDNIKPSKFYFMTHNDTPELISVINKSFLSISTKELKKLNKEWFGEQNYISPRATLTKEEKRYIAENPEINLVSGISFAPFVGYDSNMKVTGHDIDIANLISEHTGLKINISLLKWQEAVSKAEKGEYDGLITASNSPQRQKYFLPSRPYFKLLPLIITKKDNPKNIRKIKDLSGKKVAIQKSNSYEDILKNECKNPHIIYYDTIDELIKAVVSEEVDYTLIDQTAFYTAQNMGLERMIEAPFSIGEPFAMYIQTNKNKPILQSIINKGLDSLTHNEKQKVRNKWFGNININSDEKKAIRLSPEERVFLNRKKELTCVIYKQNMPLDGISSEGRYIGITPDYLTLLAKKLQTKFKIITTTAKREKILQQIASNKYDFAAISENSLKKTAKLVQTSPYTSYPNVIVTHNNNLSKNTISLNHNKLYAIVAQNPLIDSIRQKYPKFNYIEVANIKTGLTKVENHEAFGFIDTSANIQYAIKDLKFDNLQVTATLPLTTKFILTVNSENTILHKILQKAVNSLTPTERERINNKWLAVTVSKITDYELISKIVIIVAFILIIIIFWNRKLRYAKQKTEKTLSDLKETQVQLIQAEKMAALGQLISGIAHEINTPLGAIKSSGEHITSALDKSLMELPDIFKSLTPTEEEAFLMLIKNASSDIITLSSKELRRLRRQLVKELQNYQIINPHFFAEIFLHMGLTHLPIAYLPLLKHTNAEKIMRIAKNVFSIQTNSENINTAVNRAAKIIFALKSFSFHDPEGKRSKEKLSDNIETVLTLYHHQIKHGIEIIRDYSNIPPILCYPDELCQVWTNLIHNSIQAMNNNGKITITINKQNNHAVITISDTGCGIPDEIQHKLFNPFFTTKKSGEGTGLGLDIVKKIIDKHQGTITFNSKVGLGTNFTIRIPYNDESEK